MQKPTLKKQLKRISQFLFLALFAFSCGEEVPKRDALTLFDTGIFDSLLLDHNSIHDKSQHDMDFVETIQLEDGPISDSPSGTLTLSDVEIIPGGVVSTGGNYTLISQTGHWLSTVIMSNASDTMTLQWNITPGQ